MSPLKPVDMWVVKKWEQHEFQQQIEARRELIRQMVGTLYPGIIAAEIKTIENEIDRRRYEDQYEK